jgi:Transglycosylase SLT domain
MNKVNLILLIIAMFTGFPAIVAVSQNITVTTPSEAYFSISSSSVVQTISSNSIASQVVSNISLSSSISSSLVSSSESVSKVVEIEALKIIEVKPIISEVKIMQDIKKPEPINQAPKPEPKPIVKQEIKTESKIAEIVENPKPVAKIIEIKPIEVSSSSAVSSSNLITPTPKANMTFAEQITARCEALGCNASQMIRIMKCESSGNPTVVGGGLYVGLFQFLPSTFNAYKIKAGLPNGDIYNGSDQIHVATYMFANGQARQWECK